MTLESYYDKKLRNFNIMNNKDNIILKQLMHMYDEECARFETVDNKLIGMIRVLATIFTIQTSLFSLIINSITNSQYAIIIYILFITSEVCYLVSAFIFIITYNFKTSYEIAPTEDLLQYYHYENSPKNEIMGDLIDNYSQAIKTNYNSIESKTNDCKKGFIFLLIGMIFSFILINILICLKI